MNILVRYFGKVFTPASNGFLDFFLSPLLFHTKFYCFLFLASENKLQVLNFGALEHLVKLISHDDKHVKRNATMCIGSVASESKRDNHRGFHLYEGLGGMRRFFRKLKEFPYSSKKKMFSYPFPQLKR